MDTHNINLPIPFFIACNFIILSLTLLLLQTRIGVDWSFQIPAILLCLNACVAFLDYIFTADTTYPLVNILHMDMQISAIFLIIGIAVLLADPRCGFVGILFSNSLSGVLLRRIPIIIFVISGIFAVTADLGQNHGLYDNAFGDMLTLISTIVMLIVVLWINASLVSRQEYRLLSVEKELNTNIQLSNLRIRLTQAIGKIITSGESFNKIAKQILQSIITHLDLDRGEAWLIDTKKNNIVCNFTWLKDLKLNAAENLPELEVGNGIAGKLWQNGKPIWDIQQIQQENGITTTNTVIGIPISYKGNILGAFIFYSDKIRPFDSNLLAVLELIAIQIGEYISHKHTEQQMSQIITTDHLTGLMTRTTLEKNINEKIQGMLSPTSIPFMAIILFDIDKFNMINTALGYDTGDALLQAITERLLQLCAKPGDLLARIATDKFVIVPEGVISLNQTVDYAYKIFSMFKSRFYIIDKELYLSTSIGLSFFPNDGDTANELLKKAEIALGQAKKMGENNFQIYKSELTSNLTDRLQLENDMRQALANGEFVLYFQPKVSLKTGTITSVEALLRWQHPQRGIVSPGLFMPLVEESNLIIPISEWIIRDVCELIAKHALSIPIAINISANHIKPEYNLAAYLKQITQGYHVPTTQIELEITETVLLGDTQEVLNILANLKSLGFKLTLDDFGTKFSSLNYLKNIAVDHIKIDKSFIDNIPGNRDNVTIIKAIIAMFHALDKKIIAEGVETVEQLTFLIMQNCDEVQGNYFSEPLPLKQIRQYILEQKTWELPST
jgi:diguanylate cyclase (GGDEF)-like protein